MAREGYARAPSSPLMERAAETDRQLGDLNRFGEVVEVAGALCRVKLDEGFETDWIRMPMLRAGRFRIWSRLSLGEQVRVAFPEGEISAAVIQGVEYSDAFPPPTDEDVLHIEADDGFVFSYNPDTHQLLFELPDAGKVLVRAPAGVKIEGPLDVQGDITSNGKMSVVGPIASNTDVKAGTISLKNLRVTGIQPGAGVSGMPQQ